jgi:hypothetical protein
MFEVMPRSQSNTARAPDYRRCALPIYWTRSLLPLAREVGRKHRGDTGGDACEALVTEQATACLGADLPITPKPYEDASPKR